MSKKIFVVGMILVLTGYQTARAEGPIYVGEDGGIIGIYGKDYQYVIISDSVGGTPGEGWYDESFDHSGWSVGETPFANEGSCLAPYTTLWPANSDVYVFKTFSLAQPIPMVAKIAVDNGYDLYVNGAHVANANAEGCTYYWEYTVNLSESLFRAGNNTLALHLEDHGYETAWDFALVGSEAFSGSGSGTQEDPYIITNVYELQEMNNDLDAWYELGNDIDASATRYWNEDPCNPGVYFGFEPIGNDPNKFTGHFDGKEHTITDLFINRPDTDDIGLFGYIDEESEIKNVGILNADITGKADTGALVGCSYFSTIVNCYSTGKVDGRSTHVGGLAGTNGYGQIIGSYSTVNVVGAGNYVGGLVGYSYGFGTDVPIARITNSYSTGSVTGNDFVGDLVGYLWVAEIANCYATGSINGIRHVGGLVGLEDNGTITNSYSTGSVTGNDFVGGLVGSNYGGTCNDCFWDIETSGQTTSACGVGKTTAEMKQQATFTNWDFETVWDIVECVNYPFLRENNPFRKMIKPIEGYLTSCFGWRNRNGKQEFHNGIDISRSGINGTEIVAPADGEVIDAGYDEIAGYWIKIQHGEIVRLDSSIAPNVSTSYCHLFELPSLQPADKIAQGDVIGKVGSSGDSTGPHLHFIVREDGKSVDPLRYVDYSPRPGKGLTCDALSPVDITIIDPHGYLISKDLIEIEETATYLEDDLDGDGDLDDRICITNREVGTYIINIIPEPNAQPTDTYSLEVTSDGQTVVLAENIQVQDIPTEPYLFESKLCYSDFDGNGSVDLADLAVLRLHWLAEDCNYPSWCDGTDLNYNGRADFIDFAIFADNWLWETIPGDLDIDGDVDFADYAVLANYWLQPPGTPSADIAPPPDGDSIVNFLDLAVLAEHWLEGVTP